MAVTGLEEEGFWRRYRNRVLLSGLAVGLLLGARASMDRLGGLEDGEVPTAGAFAVALALLVVGQLVVGYGWRRLAPDLRDPVASQWTFHATQPGKYLPLGVGQAVGQVALARDLGMTARSAMAAWASHILMIVAGGVVTGVLLVFRTDAGPVRFLALLCLLGAVFVHRGVLGRLVGLGSRFSSRLPAAADLPDQRRLADAFAAAVVFVVLHGAAFSVLLDGHRDIVASLAVLGAYGLSVGLSTATPLPAGLGIREGLLVLLVGGAVAPVLAAAIVLRVCTFTMEVSLLAVFWLLRRLVGPQAAEPDPSKDR